MFGEEFSPRVSVTLWNLCDRGGFESIPTEIQGPVTSLPSLRRKHEYMIFLKVWTKLTCCVTWVKVNTCQPHPSWKVLLGPPQGTGLANNPAVTAGLRQTSVHFTHEIQYLCNNKDSSPPSFVSSSRLPVNPSLN